MISGWDETSEAAKQHAQGDFLSLQEDGDSAEVAVVRGPFAKEVVWIEQENGKERPEVYDESNEEHKGQKKRLVVGFEVFNRTLGKRQLWEVNTTLFKRISKIRDKQKGKKLEGIWWTIIRSGAKGDTKTTYEFQREDKIAAEDLALIKDSEELDLNKLFMKEDDEDDDSDDDKKKPASSKGKGGKKAEEKEEKEDEKTDDDDTAVMGDKDQTKMIQSLKTFPKEKMDEFMAHFKIKRVRDLPASKAKEAFKWIDDNAPKGDADEGDSEEENDPFA